ncbi:MAG: helix-turn-helix transcriptional regulator [Patescibacteria group bacterium]|nr:helix-turn-helix transcriptional regulator [Patescibacteria group bacterium]
MKNYKQLKNRLLKDKEVKKSYEALRPEFEFITAIIKKRIEKGLTQKMLAKKLGTKQSAISRLESGAYNPSFAFLKKIVNAMNLELKISLVEKQ